jgi:hypothetical protein
MAIEALFRLPFEEQISFFRNKLNVPTARWDDLWKDQHAKGFMIAGAMKADLLNDFRQAVDKAIAGGATLADFRKDFDRIVARHGWSYKGGRNWRSRVIYDTNVRTAYAAGRWKQLQDPEVKRFYGCLVYRHGDSRVPRPIHLSWDGITLPADDPWWKTHYVPNGWGCKCKVFAATQEDRQRAGAKGEAPPSPIDPKTSEPVGIDRGWGYNVGDAVAAKYNILRSAVSRLPDDIANALIADIEAMDKKAARIARKIRSEAARQAKAAPDDVTAWKKVSDRKGSNPGGLYEAPDGQRYYVKFYADPGQARTEFAANAVYRMMGVEMPELTLRDWDGKLALVSKWRTDLKAVKAAEMIAHPEEMAKIFQASVLTKNWDVVGMEFDNVMLGKNGRLAMIDAGGSFKYRAQGGLKPYEAMPAEVKTLRDTRLNRQSAEVFNAVFGRDVWLERAGAEGLLNLKKADVAKVFKGAGFAAEEAKELTETLWKRRQYLIDRYDLENRLVPAAFGKHLEEFKKWGVARWQPNEVNGLINGSADRGFQSEIEALVGKFEAYAMGGIHKWGRGVLRNLFREWSYSSSSEGGAAIKLWAEARFGKLTKYHSGKTSREEVISGLSNGSRRSFQKAKLPQETVFSLLDAEYEFQQYLMRRLHGYEEIPAVRFMSSSEFSSNFRGGSFSGNSVQSVTVRVDGFGGSRCVRMNVRVEDTVKTYYQGGSYMHFGKGESEYVVVGRAVSAEVIR